MSAGGGKKSAGGPAAAATPVLLTGALALKVCDRILAQVVVCKEKDPVQLLELLLHDASLEEKLLQRVLCLGYTAAASRAMKEAAPKLAIERLLLARSAGEEATRLDAFSLLSHWALVRAAGWCWETINEITPEEAPEAQAVLHRATGKIITYVFMKDSPKFVADFDALLAVERTDLGVPESITSPLMLSRTVKQLVWDKLKELIMNIKPGCVSPLSTMLERGYADAKVLADFEKFIAERAAGAPGGGAAAQDKPSQSERSTAWSTGGDSGASSIDPLLELKRAKERREKKERLQRQKPDVLAYCQAVVKEERLSDHDALMRFSLLTGQELEEFARPARAASSADKAKFRELFTLLEGRSPKFMSLQKEKGYWGSRALLFEELAQDAVLTVRDVAPLWLDADAFSPESGSVCSAWEDLFLDGDDDVAKVLLAVTHRANAPPAGSVAAMLLARELLLRADSPRRAAVLCVMSRLAHAEDDEEELETLKYDLGLIGSTPVPSLLSHHQHCGVCELLPESLLGWEEGDASLARRLCGADDCLADEGSLPCRGVRFTLVPETTAEQALCDGWNPHCYAPLSSAVASEEVELSERRKLSCISSVAAISSAGAEHTGTTLPGWDNLQSLGSLPPAQQAAFRTLYMSALPPPATGTGMDSLGLDDASQLILRKSAVSDICLGLTMLCESHLLLSCRVREIMRFVGRCLGLDKTDRPLFESLAELQPRQLVILARYVRRLWDSNVIYMRHYLAFAEANRNPGAFLLVGKCIEPSSTMMIAVRKTAESENISVVESFVNLLYSPIEEEPKYARPEADLDQTQQETLFAELKAVRSLMVELKESMKPLESGLGDLLLAHHTLASFVHTDAMPSGESADDESRSLENVDFEKFMGTLPADRLPILRNRVMRLLEAIVAACLAYVRAQLTSIAVEIGGAKLQSGSGNKGGAELVRLRAVERRLLAEKLKRQEDAHLINAIGQHLSADADNAPHGFHELIGMLGSERYGWRLIPRMQAALEGLTVISGELLRRHYALVSKLCDARTIDRRGVTLRPIAELLRAKLYSAAVERASKELEQPSASAAAPAAAKPPAASAPKEKKGSADDKKARKAEAKKLAAAEAARAAAEAAAAELAARDAARKAAAEETERRMAEALAARAAELRQKQADEDAAALEQMQRANAAQQMRAQAQRASEAAAAAEAERVARAEAEAREAEDREQAQRAEAERAAAAAVAADAAALNSRGSVTPAPPVIIQLPTPLPPWEAQPPLPLPPFSPPPPPLAAPARVEDRVAGLESQLAQMTAAMAALQAQLASSALEAAHQQNRAAAGPSTLVEASLCVICDDALRDRLLMPCCHLALCGGCVALHSPKMCPICRAPVASFLTVLHP